MSIPFAMVSKSFFIFLVPIILQCRLALSVDERGLGEPGKNPETSPILLSELLDYFRRIQYASVNVQLLFMFLVASYGDHMYPLSANLSSECWKTAAATSLMMQKLAITEEATTQMYAAGDRVTADLRDRTTLKEHPLELLCTEIKKLFAEKSDVSVEFEKAKKNAANFETTNRRRPPYFRQLIKPVQWSETLVTKYDVPELAKFIAHLVFRILLGGREHTPMRWFFFVRSCLGVARNETFADSMQKIYEKAIEDVLPQIMVSDRIQKFRHFGGSYWWDESLMKILYGYVATDPILKKAVDDAVIIVCADATISYSCASASKEDFDFSKI